MSIERILICMLVVMCLFSGCFPHSKQTTVSKDKKNKTETGTGITPLTPPGLTQSHREANGRTDKKYRLAIFPCKIIQFGSYTPFTHEHSIRTIYSKIREYNQITVLYSYYAFKSGEKDGVKFNPPNGKKQLTDIWQRKTLFSKMEPNIEDVINIGKNMHVDLVLMLYVYGSGYFDADFYLVDINGNNIFKRTVSQIQHAKYYRILEEETQTLIDQFLQALK